MPIFAKHRRIIALRIHCFSLLNYSLALLGLALPLLFFAQPQLLGGLHIRGFPLPRFAVASPCRALPQHIATA